MLHGADLVQFWWNSWTIVQIFRKPFHRSKQAEWNRSLHVLLTCELSNTCNSLSYLFLLAWYAWAPMMLFCSRYMPGLQVYWNDISRLIMMHGLGKFLVTPTGQMVMNNGWAILFSSNYQHKNYFFTFEIYTLPVYELLCIWSQLCFSSLLIHITFCSSVFLWVCSMWSWWESALLW